MSSPMSSNSSSNSSPVISPSGRIKKRPPPLVIPDSNFFNFKDDVQSAPVDILKNTQGFEDEDSKQSKATSLDKNITLFKQKSFDESIDQIDCENAALSDKEDISLIEENDKKSKEKSTFLGKCTI